MSRILVFRPGVAPARSAFEAQARLYRWLQENRDFEFCLVTGDSDTFRSAAFSSLELPNTFWKPVGPLALSFRAAMAGSELQSAFESADAVVTVDPTVYPQGLLGIRLARRAGAPIYVDTSLSIRIADQIVWRLRRKWVTSALEHVDGVLATAPNCMERWEALGILSPRIARRISFLGHPVDTDRFAPGADDGERDGRTIVVLSRLAPTKGIVYILEAVAPLLRGDPNLGIRFIGDGPLAGWLREEVERRGLEERVDLLGEVDHGRLPSLLREGDLYVSHAVSTTRWEEFFGVANLEAMATGLPCILTTSGAIPYVTRSPNVARYVSQRDVVGLREAIEELLESPEQRSELGANARTHVENTYSLPQVGNRFERALASALSR